MPINEPKDGLSGAIKGRQSVCAIAPRRSAVELGGTAIGAAWIACMAAYLWPVPAVKALSDSLAWLPLVLLVRLLIQCHRRPLLVRRTFLMTHRREAHKHTKRHYSHLHVRESQCADKTYLTLFARRSRCRMRIQHHVDFKLSASPTAHTVSLRPIVRTMQAICLSDGNRFDCRTQVRVGPRRDVMR